MQKLKAIVIGATGATGKELVKKLLEDTDFSTVSIFVRKSPKINHRKIIINEIDFARIENFEKLVNGDVLFSCLGTTLREAGSKAKQFTVDYSYQYEFAKLASKNGVKFYSLVSSAGANSKSIFFYPKIKGQLEESVKKLKFKTIHIFQPPSLIRQDELIRPGEKIAIRIFKGLNYLGVLKSLKPLPVSRLADKMISEIKNNKKVKFKLYSSLEI